MKPMTNGFHSSAPKISSRIILRNKKALEQVQLCIGVPAHPIAHQKRHAGYVLNTLLGGGMSSRLFQNIRERQGLAYSIYSDLNHTATPGAWLFTPERHWPRHRKLCNQLSANSANSRLNLYLKKSSIARKPN